MTRKCIVCNKEFIIPIKYSLERRKKRKYCSLGCYHKTNKYLQTTFQVGHKGMPFSSNPAWKGGRRMDEKGYIRISIGKKKWKYEHRFIMEKHLKRSLEKQEQVHHIDGNKSNNSLSNLMLFPNARAHTNFHLTIPPTLSIPISAA